MRGVLQNRCQNVVVGRRVAIWGSVRRPGKEQSRSQTGPGAKPPESYRAETAPRSDRPFRSHYCRLLAVARFYPFFPVISVMPARLANIVANFNSHPATFRPRTNVSQHPFQILSPSSPALLSLHARLSQSGRTSNCKSLLFNFQCLSRPSREIVASVTAAWPGETRRPGGRTKHRLSCQQEDCHCCCQAI